MISLVSVIAFTALASSQDRPVVKETLPNGAMVYAHHIDDAKEFSLVLAVVSVGESEKLGSHGARHLLEHLVAKGPNHEIDKVLESHGLVLRAETSRDAIVFEITGPPTEFVAALASIKTIVTGFKTTDEEVAKEVQILKEESSLRPWSMILVSDAWLKAFGETALDPFGTIEDMTKLKAADLTALYAQTFKAGVVCCAVAGDIETEKSIRQITEVIGAIPVSETIEPVWTVPGKKTEFSGSLDGEAVSIPIGPLTDASNATTIGAAFGLRIWLSGSQIITNPSARNGLVTLALPTGTGFGSAANKLRGKEQLVANSGFRLLASWKAQCQKDPSFIAKTFATVAPLRPGFNIDTYFESLTRPSQNDIQTVVRKFLNGGSGQ